MFEGHHVGAGSLLQSDLLDEKWVQEVGGIYQLDFDTALVLTADIWKHEAGGVPPFCFLLATAQRRDPESDAVDDDEVLLLRVDSVASLAQERDLLAVREEALREALVAGRSADVSEVMFGLDPYTRERISFTGLQCSILGTFYEDRSDGTARLAWGSDIDNFYASSTYRVYKPHGEVLSRIASYARPADADTAIRVPIGVVRYASTRRRAETAGHADSIVEVNIMDFIGQKTGMFGMTRMGKSNTMKTIATQVFIAAAKSGRLVGQLVFDPQGEYANINTQDRTALAAIGDDHVRIYRFGQVPAEQPHVRPLGINFFDEQQIGVVQDMIYDVLTGTGSTSGYVADFLHAELGDSDDFGQAARASRARLILYGALIRAGFTLPTGFSVRVSMKASLADKLRSQGMRVTKAGAGYISVSGDQIQNVIDWLLSQSGDSDVEDFGNDASYQSVVPIYTGTSSGRQVRGHRYLISLRDFHNPATAQPVSDEIYTDLLAARIVIVDLHLGPQGIVNRLSESIVSTIIQRQTEAFTGDQEPPHIQVIVEEAHNLFERSKYLESRDPWVRLAKEAAKLNIGLIYATQEVTGVAPQVLANTKNWVVAHLNNEREVNELSKFYDFRAFANAIIRSEDKGYVRLKTESSPFTVPVQVHLFGPDMINEARASVGLDPIDFDGGED
jgi:hypothetical protein